MFENTALKLLLEAAKRPYGTSTVQLAEEVDVSQQSVSRVLQELEREGHIKRLQLTTGLSLELTGKGRLAHLTHQGKIAKAVDQQQDRKLHGVLERGLGEGKYYVSLSHYKDHIRKLLGAEPYPGTLNLHVKPEERALFLAGIDPVEIPGYQTKERTYGAVRYYPVKVGDRHCGLLLPTRTTYGPDKVELVDTVELRIALCSTDGDEVVVEQVNP